MRPVQGGFTLIEVLVVVVIIALLATFAWPAYQDYVRQARRAEGIEMLNRLMQAQERYFTNNLSYTADLTDMGFSTASNLATERGWYLVSATPCTDETIQTCVQLTAVAQNDQTVDGDLGLNSQGRRSGSW